jgi:ketosteroid isomerase-like protein
MKMPWCVLLLLPLVLLSQDSREQDRKQIVAAYQRTIDALNRGDADAALEFDTQDWVSITLDQKPITRQEMERFIRREIASMKQPPDWAVVWKPDYEHNGTSTGIQVYDLKVSGDSAVVLYLVGTTRTETVNGETHRIWRGSHIRDTLIRTSSGWKRRMHEKLTVNEQMVDGRPVQTPQK